jgi:eukaryotic-like serine/threonine-protein kinase
MRDQRLSPRHDAPSTRVEELFNDARRQPEGLLRRRFLQRACGGDDALRRQVEGLLTSADDAEAFFQDGRSMVAATVAPLQSLAKVTAPDAEAGTDLLAGEWIGRYKLIEKLGEGGCGVVYVAEQEEPVRRRVALKIIRLGMETRGVIARFEAERQHSR